MLDDAVANLKTDCLLINSYAGSLVLGAQAAGVAIRGSYEDSGFGIEAQKLNFPDLSYVDQLPWPEDDLSNTAVLAHPPCAPFSQLLNDRRGEEKLSGVTADGFECHRNVMKYALGHGCQSLAIESVPGVMRASEEYAQAAKDHGYFHFFLRLNSVSFGVPQWRPRVWIIFRKEPYLGVDLTPRYSRLYSVMRTEGTVIAPGCLNNMVARMKKSGVPPDELRRIFEGQYGTGALLNLATKILTDPENSSEIPAMKRMDDSGPNFENVRLRWNLGRGYAAMMPRILDPEGFAPVVLGGSAWLFPGRPLFLEEYCQIMGFPPDYKWPSSFKDPRMYLSKGVCPPVAQWILETLLKQTALEIYQHVVEPGQTLDLCPTKQRVEDCLNGKEVARREPRAPRTRREVMPAEPVRRGVAEQSRAFLSLLEE